MAQTQKSVTSLPNTPHISWQYTAKKIKLALQANIFKISNVEYNKSVRTFFSASNHFLHWFSYTNWI